MKAAVLTVSDGVVAGTREDRSGDILAELLAGDGYEVERRVVADEVDEIAAAIAELAAGTPRAPLLAYRNGRGRVALTPAEVNAYVRALTGGPFTAKDFRTLRGTIRAAEALARIGLVDTRSDRHRAERLAVEATAAALGNTTAVARTSYIDPRVFRRYARGHVLDLTVSPESAIRRLLTPEHASR